MIVNKEYEKKYLCEKDEFFNILSKTREFCDIHSSSFQVNKNYYFDDSSFTYNYEKITVRIRERNGSFVLTIKDKKNYSKEKPISNEYTVSLNEKEAKKILESKIITLSEFYKGSMLGASSTLVLLGCLITKRKIYKICNVKICFDISYYLGKEDYEIEIEGECKDINHIIDKFNIITINQTIQGKRSRFLEEFKQKQNLNYNP